MIKASADIRQKAKESGVFLYQIAKELKVSEPTLTRLMRYEMTAKKKAKINSIIDKLAAERGDSDE